jgi:hypothetical protein
LAGELLHLSQLRDNLLDTVLLRCCHQVLSFALSL